MSNPSNISAGRAIVRAVRASLKVVGSSLELLTTSQLSAIQSDLRRTLTTVSGQISLAESGGEQVVIDLSDWEDEPDRDRNSDDRNGDGDAPNPTSREEVRLPIPDPYPINLPEMDELPEWWYVVDRGTEVGIFANEFLSTHAVAGTPDGHQVKVKTWREAVALYNSLWHKGLIVRVQA